VKIIRGMAILKLQGAFFMIVILNGCVGQSSVWTESDEKWWNQKPDSPHYSVVTETGIERSEKEVELESRVKEDGFKDEKNLQPTIIDNIPMDSIQNESVKIVNNQQKILPLELDEVGIEKKDNTEPVVAVDDKTLVNTAIMEFPSEYFTIQLLASSDIERVAKFAKKHQVSTQFIVETERNNEVWYVLLLGIYTDYDSAVLAGEDIAKTMKNELWIRNVGSVQEIVKK